MNVFTTDHPMTSVPSCLDTKAHPLLSFICRIFATTLVLTPFVYGWFVYSVATDDVQSTDVPDGPILMFGIPASFVFSLVCSVLMVSVYRLIVFLFGKEDFKSLKSFPL
jgi:hypothetical protein